MKYYIFIVLFFSTVLQAQMQPQPSVYNAEVYVVPPFTDYENGHYGGPCIDLWQKIAKATGIQYRYTYNTTNFEQSLQRILNGESDILIGPVRVLSNWVNKVDYSRPFFVVKMGVLTDQKVSTFWNVIKTIIKSGFGIAFLASLVFLLIISAIYCYYEFYQGKPKPPGSVFRHYLDALYLCSLGLFSTNPVKGVTKTPMKFLHVLAIGFSVLAIATCVGIVTSSITVSTSAEYGITQTNLDQVDLFKHKKVAVLRGGYGEMIAGALGAKPYLTNSIEQGIEAVLTKKADYVMADYIALKEYIKAHPHEKIHAYPMTPGASEIAFVFKKGSPLLGPVNEELLLLQEENLTFPMFRKYMDREDSIQSFI